MSLFSWFKRLRHRGLGGAAGQGKAELDAIALALKETRSAPAERGAAHLKQVLDRHVPAFLGLREPLVEQIGLDPFARMIGDFAAVERHVDLALAALMSGSGDEVPPALDDAERALARALDVLIESASGERPTEADIQGSTGGDL